MADRVDDSSLYEKLVSPRGEGSGEVNTSPILDGLSDAILALDRNFTVVYANKAACRHLLTDKEDLIGENLWKLYPEVVGTRVYEAYEKALMKNVPVEVEYEYFPAFKTWFNIRVYPSETGLTAIFRDVTQRQLALLAVEESYRTLFDEHPDAVCSIDLDGRYIAVNQAFEKMFETSESRLMGREFKSLLPKKAGEEAERLFSLARDGKPVTMEFDLSAMRDRLFYVQCTALPIIVDTEIIGAYGIVKDITTEKQKTFELRRMNHMNKLILQSVEDAILGIDKDFNVVMWNDAAEKLTGFRREELDPNVFIQLFSTLYESEMSDLKHSFDSETDPKRYEVIRKTDVTLYKKDGTPYLAEYTVTPMVSDQEVVGTVFTFRDITEKKKSEEMLHQSEKLSAVGQLAAGIAHEIRNPLTSLKGFLQLIEIYGNEKKEYFKIMKSEFGRIEQILTELLILSKPQSLDKSSFELNELLVHITALLETQAIIKNIGIEKEFTGKQLHVHCAQHQIKQVFVNLLKNAIEAMDEGGTITVGLAEEERRAVVKVTDEGCGIPKEQLKRVGEPFFSTKETGTGLGLMVTFKIIEEHGGTVQIDSEEGVGSTFTITFPLAED
ncbi:PAS domain-containing sensor histidine kinase [Alteribacter natronophilus]|uniref:PAS domain-containing sensor histidine kinase n=1 Tax=Alteribacter natronophilus TaxID=2583810 RepID=UPI00110EA42E|nr:PAS domain-containing sensor histidine kinase [Alteribacter natronophilus]TMW70437.1 PAS domain S-box protein [Alteribacter natronophilus]